MPLLHFLLVPGDPPDDGRHGDDAAGQSDGHFFGQDALADEDARAELQEDAQKLLRSVPVHFQFSTFLASDTARVIVR